MYVFMQICTSFHPLPSDPASQLLLMTNELETGVEVEVEVEVAEKPQSVYGE